MSVFDIALTPLRIARRIAGAVSSPDTAFEPPPGRLVVVDGMPEDVPEAALRPEPRLPSPAGWPFGEEFPRTCGTGRLAGGAVFWTDFLYDDHGAAGVRVKLPTGRVVPPKGTYLYPDGPAARNGADIFRVAIGLTDTHTWWRIDWNTLVDPAVPIGLFAFDTGRGASAIERWPANAGVRSAGVDMALVVSGAGAQLIDVTSGSVTAVEHSVDIDARSFLAQIPRTLVEPAGTWTVRVAAGLANESGDGFADVPPECGAMAGQPNVYNVAFRSHRQEQAHRNFWSDQAQTDALTDGDVSRFSLAVPWDQLASGVTTDEPVVTGTSTRWYVSSLELGQGVAEVDLLSSKPHFLGRVQPYSVCLPQNYSPGSKLPLTLLLHSIAMGHNQFAAVDPSLLRQLCDERNSVVAAPLSRGPSSWYLDEGELDVWEVWARTAAQVGTDPNRTVITGYSMGGYAAYRLGLTYPSVFAKAVVLAGAPACGVRILPGVDVPADLDPDSHCAREGETWPLLRNARWLPFVIAHGVLDEFVPFASVLPQVFRLDRLGYRYRFTTYPIEDHVAFALQGKFDDPVAHVGTLQRQSDPGHITFSWYPQLVRPELGIGPHRVWWLSKLRATEEVTANRGELAGVDAHSYALPDPIRKTRRRGGLVLNFHPTPGLYAEQDWQLQPPAEPKPYLVLRLRGVASLTVDIARAGLAAPPHAELDVTTDSHSEITLDAVPDGTTVRIDDDPSGPTVSVPAGQHRIRLVR